MNAGVRLVQSYLRLNGYFTVTELPVIRGTRGGGYEEVTDLDMLGVRFPYAEYSVSRGRPGSEDDLRIGADPILIGDHAGVDVIIGEVKEGKARVNEAMRKPDALETALRRVGCCPDDRVEEAVQALQRSGEFRLPMADGCFDVRVRVVAFGEGETGDRNGYTVVSLAHAARFVEAHLDRYHDVLNPADLGDTALGILHLLRKLR
jgi:hypothetical protein